MKIELLDEPLIEFAEDFLCDDPKKGIATTGFYSLSNNTHRSEINYAVIGTKKQIALYDEMILRFSQPIESGSVFKIKNFSSQSNYDEEIEFEEFKEEDDIEYVGINKKLNPDFPGFNSKSCFKCKFQNNAENNFIVKEKEVNEILDSDLKKSERLLSLIELYKSAYLEIIENNLSVEPDIIVIVIGDKTYDQLSTIKIQNKWLNFRRFLKAEILSLGKNVPVQLILEGTIKEEKKSIQDTSMIAWNYCVAQYYKTANCTPWTLKDLDIDTCYLGISFHKVNEFEDNSLRSSIAQAFNKDGQGLVFTGKQFKWNKNVTKVTSPHLKKEYAYDLVKRVLIQYQKLNKHTPKRIVIHKTSEFWDYIEHPEHDEIGGLMQGIEEVLGTEIEIDLVSIKGTSIRILREGQYPVLRGTYLPLTDQKSVLYTSGFIPYFNTYPGTFVPSPLIIENIGETPIKDICKEILALTKMNFNNADYCDSFPITLQFSQKVGEIIQYFPETLDNPPNKYYYYM